MSQTIQDTSTELYATLIARHDLSDSVSADDLDLHVKVISANEMATCV